MSTRYLNKWKKPKKNRPKKSQHPLNDIFETIQWKGVPNPAQPTFLLDFSFCFSSTSFSAGSCSGFTSSVSTLPEVARKSFTRRFCNFRPTSEKISTAQLWRSLSFRFNLYLAFVCVQTCFTWQLKKVGIQVSWRGLRCLVSSGCPDNTTTFWLLHHEFPPPKIGVSQECGRIVPREPCG